MRGFKNCCLTIVLVFLTLGCSQHAAHEPTGNAAMAVAPATPPEAARVPAPGTPAPVGSAGFDPAGAPEGHAPPGAKPYFRLMDIYARVTPKNSQSSAGKRWLEDAKFDRFELFDSAKLIPFEGRAFVTLGQGTAASWF